MSDPKILFGFPSEWEGFAERNPRFLDLFPRLQETMKHVFEREFHPSEPIEHFINLFGRMCMEEFYEILLLCGNGYGHGAQKILRGFWEKAVTLEYLSFNSSELADFFDYHYISDHKLYDSVKDIIGKDALPQAIIDQNAADYLRVKDRFLISDCKKCRTFRVNYTWNKLDVVSMSKQTRLLGKLVNEAYYIPMQQAHSTAQCLIMRLEQIGEDTVGFNPDSQRKPADSAMRTAHLIVLEILEVERRFYDLEYLTEEIEQCKKDWMDIYRNPNNA